MTVHEYWLALLAYLFHIAIIMPTIYVLLLKFYSKKYSVPDSDLEMFFLAVKNPTRTIITLFSIYPVTNNIGYPIFQSYGIGLLILSTIILSSIVMFLGLLAGVSIELPYIFLIPTFIVGSITILFFISMYMNIRNFIKIYSNDNL